MKVELNWVEYVYHSKTEDFEITEEMIKSINRFIEDEGDLEEAIRDIVWQEVGSDYSDDVRIDEEDLDELVEKFSYLIEKSEELTCCDKSKIEAFTYCPRCGSKLNY